MKTGKRIIGIMILLCLMAGIYAGAEQAAVVTTQSAETTAITENAATGGAISTQSAPSSDENAEKAAQAAAVQTADSRVEAFLQAQAAEQKDGWVLAILQAGARNVSWEGNTATFSLRSFDPGLKSLGAYAKADKAAWRKQAMENIAAYNLQVSVTFEADSSVGKKQASQFLKTVKNAASSAKGSFGKKDMASAMTDLIYCAPTAYRQVTAASLMTADAAFASFIAQWKEYFPCESAAEWAPIFYLQRAWKYAVKDGPHALRLSWDAADPTNFLNQAYDSVTEGLAAMTKSQRPGEDSLPATWKNALAETAIKVKKGRLVSQSAIFDIDDLIAGKLPEGYTAYFAKYTPDQTLERLIAGYRQLPDMASEPIPKTKVLSQAKKGRGILVKVPKDGRNTYVQLRDADTGVIRAEAFIRPGANVTMKVPEGVYVVQYASGSTWYGTANTFGPLGTYTASDEFIVAKKKWNLTAETEQAGITLHAITAESLAPTEDTSIHIAGTFTAPEGLLKAEGYPANNPVIPGVSSTTGLEASGEKYTPVVMVLDNAEEAYPHWGVSQADIIFQIPNAGSGATKLLALFADHYPEQAGPVRSGRATMLPVALSFDAAFTYAGPPAVSGGEVDITELMQGWGMNRAHKVYNLLNNNGFSERWKTGNSGGHNLSCHIQEIHQNLIAQDSVFEERPFLFTDAARTDGEDATIIRVLHRGEDPNGASNSASRAVFKFDPATGMYLRNNSSGTYSDRLTGENVPFANVLVLRTRLSYDRNYLYLTNHLVGSGCLEIFQNGKYVRGAWVRESLNGRLVLVGPDGEELALQRGKTFIVVTNDVTDVIYTN